MPRFLFGSPSGDTLYVVMVSDERGESVVVPLAAP